jgi:hypothetical protein
MTSWDEEKAASSDEDKITPSNIQGNAEARQDVSVPNHASHLELISFVEMGIFVSHSRINGTFEEPQIAVPASKSIQ